MAIVKTVKRSFDSLFLLAKKLNIILIQAIIVVYKKGRKKMTELKIYLEDLLVDAGFSTVLAALLISLVVILIWLLVGMIASKISRKSIEHYFIKRKGDARGATLSGLLSGAVKVVIWFIVILLIISELGFEITPILASAGILGLAIGFGAQSLVKDVMSGFFIIVDNSFNVGETIEVSGFKGKVTAMNLRVTHITNYTGSEMIVNNGNISSLINWSRNTNLALVDFGVAYETDLEKIQSIMPEFIDLIEEKNDDIIEKPTFLGVTELADSSINMRISAKTTTGNHFGVERMIRHELVLYLNKHEVEIPFPQVVVSNKA